MMRAISCMLLMLAICHYGYTQGLLLKGTVRDSIGQGIAKVTITELGTGRATLSNNQGEFELLTADSVGSLLFQHISFTKLSKKFSSAVKMLDVTLYASTVQVEEIVVSTGYQQLPKERATGSFEVINAEKLQTRTGGNIIDRLEGLVPGLQFESRQGRRSYNIRGINTLSYKMMDPLIILDNFPYQGDISNINPSDIATVTILKDAAAASIWGSRAGNGVIVITSKKAAAGQKTSIEYSSTVNLTEKPDLYYTPKISSSDFIDVEQFLFDKGHYDAEYYGAASIKNTTIFSPVVSLLYQAKEGKLGADELQAAIARYRGLDVRRQALDLFYRKPLEQQHYVAFNTSSAAISHRITLGFDPSTGDLAGMRNRRFNIRSVNRFQLAKNLVIESRLSYTNQHYFSHSGIFRYNSGVGGGKSSLYPYAELVDKDNNALAIPQDYNMDYLQGLQGSLLLDWLYKPVEDMDKTIFNDNRHHIQGQLALDYKPFDGFSINLLYNKTYEPYDMYMLYREDSYFARDLINRYTQIDGQNIKYILPKGGIKSSTDQSTNGYNVRAQLNYQKIFAQHHDLNMLLGAEVSDRVTQERYFKVFGYDEDLMSSQEIDPLNTYPIYDGLSSDSRLPESASSFSSTTQRFVSAFFNLGYVFNNKYGWSFSTRRDGSNLFGVKTNDKWKPLWSTGLSWQLDKEGFLQQLKWVDQLKIRATYGHSGNSGGVANSLPIIDYEKPHIASLTREPRARITSLPNPTLRWEDVAMINLGLDYSLFANRISGSFEVYTKKSTDLLANDLMDITTGYETIRRNVAELKGKGIDARIAGNYSMGKLSFTSALNFSYSKNWVTKFYGTDFSGGGYARSFGTSLYPIVGKPPFSIHAFKFAGLDPLTGDPRGYLQGEISKEYNKLLSDSVQNLDYFGSSIPPYYGSFTQHIRWKNLSLSFLISFKMGHYFQKKTISYYELINSWRGHKDYEKRWQKPGDEQHTTVSSMVYPAVYDRDRFYAASSANVLSGDLIRLQDVGLDYRFSAKLGRQRIGASLFLKVNNLGILWRGNKQGLDPDAGDIPVSRRYAMGISLNY